MASCKKPREIFIARQQEAHSQALTILASSVKRLTSLFVKCHNQYILVIALPKNVFQFLTEKDSL